MKSILFVINTLGQGGAEMALISLLEQFDPKEYEIDLYVMVGQGNLIHRIPDYVHILNRRFDDKDVLDQVGKRHLMWHLFEELLHVGSLAKNMPYILSNYNVMQKNGTVHPEKLIWRTIADSAPRFEKEYDLAVAYLEGASTYYVAQYVKARKKVAYVHVSYGISGYTRELDKGCYEAFDRIFTVGQDVQDSFTEMYPEHSSKTMIFYNIVDKNRILKQAEEGEGFEDGFSGTRILTVARLIERKGIDTCIRAAKILDDRGKHFRWYVLGEGEERSKLEALIDSLGLQNEFILYGTVSNPYPYYRQCDIYVHSSKYEGRSIAIQEAQILGKAMVVTDTPGSSEMVIPEENALLVKVDETEIADAVQRLMEDRSLAQRLGEQATLVDNGSEDLPKLLMLVRDDGA